MHSGWFWPAADMQLGQGGEGAGQGEVETVVDTVVSFGGNVVSGAGEGTSGQVSKAHLPSYSIMRLHSISDLPMHSGWSCPAAEMQVGQGGEGAGEGVDAVVDAVVSFGGSFGGEVVSGAGVGISGQVCKAHLPSNSIMRLHSISDLPMHSGWFWPAADMQLGQGGEGAGQGEVETVVDTVVSFGGNVVSGAGEGTSGQVSKAHLPSYSIMRLHSISDLPMHSGWSCPAAEMQVGQGGEGAGEGVDAVVDAVVDTVVSFGGSFGGEVVSGAGVGISGQVCK